MKSSNQPENQIFSNAKVNFDRNKKDINDLLEIHDQMDEVDGRESDKPGRRPDRVQVLHRAAIVMIIACWQAYIEDLFCEKFEHLLSSSSDPEKIPDAIKYDIFNVIRNDRKDDREYIWKFAGNGWKEIVLKEWKDKKLKKFNTPSDKEIDKLFKETLGNRVLA